jgi:hypothetical protein
VCDQALRPQPRKARLVAPSARPELPVNAVSRGDARHREGKPDGLIVAGEASSSSPEDALIAIHAMS